MATIQKINLEQSFARINEHWSPKIAGELNDFQVKLAKLQGEFVWHHHGVEDELFLIVKGSLTMHLREGDIVLGPGEFVIIPHGVEHCPAAAEECCVLLIEPNTTLNTGNLVNERTLRTPDRL
jgi:mannose-6-phosphate isomerase-like protein (cupin superfamily)